MKRLFTLALAACLSALLLGGFQDFSHLTAVEPDSAKVGDVASAKGENLGKAKISELYLTDGKNDIKTVITEQTDGEIKFKVPKAEAGRYRLMLLNASKSSMAEQPVVITIE
jgi:hypothetical protein